MTIHEYLNTPIPRKVVLSVVIGQALGSAVTSALLARKFAKQANEVIMDQDERLRIYSETTEFLMERADERTMHELNHRLDYWRVIRGMPAEMIQKEGE